MRYSEALVAWTPAEKSIGGSRDRPGIMIGPLLQGGDDWTRGFRRTGGAAFVEVRKLTGFELVAKCFIDFHTIVVRDGIDPQEAHKEFLKVDEYKDFISPDIPGARK